MKALSHATDPQTSFDAADRLKKSGTADTHRQIVLRTLHLWPGATASELAGLVHARYGRHGLRDVGLEPDCPKCLTLQVRKRLSDLHNAGLAVRSGCRCASCSPVDQTMKARGGEEAWMAQG